MELIKNHLYVMKNRSIAFFDGFSFIGFVNNEHPCVSVINIEPVRDLGEIREVSIKEQYLMDLLLAIQKTLQLDEDFINSYQGDLDDLEVASLRAGSLFSQDLNFKRVEVGENGYNDYHLSWADKSLD